MICMTGQPTPSDGRGHIVFFVSPCFRGCISFPPSETMLPMRLIAVVAASVAFVGSVAAVQGQPPGGRGEGRVVVSSPRTAYPERPPGDPAAIARGKVLYGANCQFSHGADIRGGDGGPSLLRSGVVLDD